MYLYPIISVLALVIVSSKVYAYKEPTHEEMSSNAIEISILSVEQTLLTDFGLEIFSSKQEFTNPDNPNGIKVTIINLVRNGAKFEDNTLRAFNHFYDPVNNKPLTVLGKEIGNTSPDWALEDNGDVDPDKNGEQLYSYKEANDYFFRALTESTEEVREENWGKVFQTLGQVIHHVQDMAQPDHVRNDQHNDVTDSSFYEEYTNNHKDDAYFINLMSSNIYPIPKFDTAREYWSTTDDKGIADFTNQNFVSKDTNFQIKNNVLSSNTLYALPVPGSRVPETLNNLLNDGGVTCQELLDSGPIDLPENADCIVEFISSDINDNFNPASNGVNNRAASLSLYDEYLVKYNISDIQIEPEEGHLVDIDEIPTLNKFNYDAAHQYLIPRAVAYSAGLINHFFKAKFEVTVDHINKAFVIKNLSGSVMHGQINLYVETVDTGARGLNQIWNISDYAATGLNNGAEISIPAPDLSQYSPDLMFVYTGFLNEIVSELYVYANKVFLKGRAGGAFSIVHDETGVTNFEISTYVYNNLNLGQFTTSVISSLVDDPTGQTGNKYRHNIFNNFHWQVASSNGNGMCVIEAVGNWDVTIPDFGDDFFFRMFTDSDWSGAGTEQNVNSDFKFGDYTGLVTPLESDCAAAPIGYRSASWSNGWISKYPTISGGDLGFYIESLVGAEDFVHLATNSLKILDGGTCRVATIQDVRNNWTPNSSYFGNIGPTHAYVDQNELISDNPLGYLKAYIPQNILNYSCW